MAVRDVVVVEIGGGTQMAKWLDLDAADSGKPVAMAMWPDKTIQVVGGTSVDIQGSNDGGTTWVPINDIDGADLTTVVPGIYLIRDNPALIRPNNTAGSNMAVYITAR